MVSPAGAQAGPLLRRPFEVGHRTQIGEHAGDVIDIRLFKFSLMEIGSWARGAVAGKDANGEPAFRDRECPPPRNPLSGLSAKHSDLAKI